MNELRRRALFVGLAAAFAVLLAWNYDHVIAPVYYYSGFVHGDGGYWRSLIAWIFALLPALWLPLSPARPSQLCACLLYFCVYVPSCIVPCYSLGGEINILPLQCVLLVSLLIVNAAQVLPPLAAQRLPLRSHAFWFGVAAYSLVVCALIFRRFGIVLQIPSLTDVYAVREEFAGTLSESSGMLAYLIFWQANVVHPFLLVHGFLRGRRWLVLLIAALQVWLFCLTGFKHVLFTLLLLPALLWLLWSERSCLAIRFAAAGVALIALCTGGDLLLGSEVPWLSTLFVRRIFLVPGLLTGYYYDYFADGPKVLLSTSVLRFFVENPYNAAPPKLIGLAYFGSYTTSANANIWADAFANFGFGGMLAFSCLLAALLWFVDGMSRGVDRRVAILLFAIPLFALTNTGLLTTISTHGLAAALAILMTMPAEPGKDDSCESCI